MKNKLIITTNLILALILIFINCTLIFIERYFGEVSLSQLIFHINFSNNLLLDSDEYIIRKLYQICLYLPILTYLLVIFFIWSLKKNLFINKFLTNINILIIMILLIIVTFIKVQDSVKFSNLFSLQKDDIIKKYYVDPKTFEFDFKDSKNLVLVYMESYETIFADKELFGENLIEQLNNYNQNSTSLDNFIQTPLTNWTIASIVATQCGLPLKNLGIFNFGTQKGKHERQVFGFKDFLPKASCLGDIFKIGNYRNIFISSPNTSFSGTGKFFLNHKFDEIYGKEIFDKLNLSYKGGSWGGGPHDSFLFDFTKDKIDELIENNKKFNINLLTTDTHEPNGFLDPNCKFKITNISNVIKCSTNELYEFIKYIETNYQDKVNIIILGDHLFRFTEENFKKKIPKKRTIYNKFISTDDHKFKRDKIIHYDLMPTILDFVNIDYNGSKLGMGLSVFKEVDEKKYNNRLNEIKDNILNKSDFYETFWK